MRPPYPCNSAAHCTPENQISHVRISFADHHPCNRRSSSSPDVVPIRTPSNARLWPPGFPGLLPPSCNARWHHQRTAQTDFADTSPTSTDQKHSAETDSLTGGGLSRLAAGLTHAALVHGPL